MKLQPLNKFFATVLVFLATLFSLAQAQPRGETYRLNPPQPVENDGKIEVLEFFAYGCIHCFHLEPYLEQWAAKLPADVKFRRVPAGPGFEFRGIDSTVLFYTLEAIGALDKAHWKALRAANVEGVALGSPGVLKDWLSKLGVDIAKFEEAQKSFSVQSKVAAARRMTQNYALSSTPLIVINGRVAVTTVDKPERMLETVNREIEAVRASARAPAR